MPDISLTEKLNKNDNLSKKFFILFKKKKS